MCQLKRQDVYVPARNVFTFTKGIASSTFRGYRIRKVPLKTFRL